MAKPVMTEAEAELWFQTHYDLFKHLSVTFSDLLGTDRRQLFWLVHCLNELNQAALNAARVTLGQTVQ